MDYEIGSIADLISGNHTPNRRKVAKKPLTPVKLPPSLNVTPRDSENNKSRTPKLAFTPEVNVRSSTKSKPPTDQFESPKSVPKKRKSKLFNNFQFLSQLPDHSDSENEEFGEDDGSASENENESFKEKKKSKKYSKEDAKKVIKEYYVGKSEINGNPTQTKKEKNRPKSVDVENVNNEKKSLKKKNVDIENASNEEKSPKKKKINIAVELNESVKRTEKKSKNALELELNTNTAEMKKKKKQKNKDKLLNIAEEYIDQGDTSPKKKKKRKSESENDKEQDDGDDDLKRDSGSDNGSDDELPVSDNELNINEAKAELEEYAEESEDENKEVVPLTDFQRAASRRIENKLLREEKFSPEETEKTLFVGNIPVSVLLKNHEKVLRNKFSPYGAIDTVRIRNIPLADFKTKPKVALIEKKFHAERTTVIAYIKFRDPASVAKALVENNSLLEGNHLRVDKCHQDRKVPVDSRKTVFLGNLPFNIEEETVRAIFDKCGPIISVRIVRDRQTQIGKGIGFINFEKSDGVELAMSMTEEDLLINKKTIRVQRYNASNNKKENKPKRNARDNKVVGKRYQQFQQPINNEYPRPHGKKRDEEGNKKRKRNLDKNYVNKRQRKNADPTDEGNNDQSFKKLEQDNSELGGNGVVQSGEHSTKKTSEDTSESVAANNNEGKIKPSRQERSIDFKGQIAKKKKKMKLNKAVLKKKKISKILLHDAKKSK